MDFRKVIPKSLSQALIIPFIMVGLMWSIEVWDWLLTLLLAKEAKSISILDAFGIRPRQLAGLPGIFLAPFLHRDFAHLSGNTLPLLGLSLILAFTGMRRFMASTLIIITVTGTAVWLFGRKDAIHLGASGIVFGYLGFLLVKGFIEKRARWIAVSILLGFLYSGLMFGMLPGKADVSWESHFFGFLSGILAAYILAHQPAPPTILSIPKRETML
ncbi:MAG: membrane associated rhomboid family serine protease [Verrucomicrobiales bacterium]|jgi:membrane associated rhomboid family serine protease